MSAIFFAADPMDLLGPERLRAWYCDKQSCAPGQCHPNDVGCAHLAQVVYSGCDGCWG